jgi:hypothetical protein
MYDVILSAVKSLEDGSKLPSDCMDRSEVIKLSKMNDSDIGRLLLRFAKEGVNFDHVNYPKVTENVAAEKVRLSEDISEKIYYTLRYISLHHQIAKASIIKILREH